MVRRSLTVKLSFFNRLHVSSEEEAAYSCLYFCGSQVLCRHWSRPRLMDDFALVCKRFFLVVRKSLAFANAHSLWIASLFCLAWEISIILALTVGEGKA